MGGVLSLGSLREVSVWVSFLSLDIERKEEYQVPPVDGSECGRGRGEGLLYSRGCRVG